MFATDGVVLMSSLLPQSLVERLLTTDRDERLSDVAISAAAKLVVNSAIGAVNAFVNRDFEKLDANPADAGCQNRALIFRELMAMDLGAKCQMVLERAKELRSRVTKIDTDDLSFTRAFIRDELGSLVVSGEPEFIIHAFVSKVMRKPFEVRENGVVMTRSTITGLEALAKRVNALGDFRSEILQKNQERLSHLSVAAMHAISSSVWSLPPDEAALLKRMLAAENRRIVAAEGFRPKTFGCLFAEIKTVLIRLREQQAVICLRSIVPKGQSSFRVFLRPPHAAEEFAILSAEEEQGLLPDTPVVIFEGVVQGNSREQMVQALQTHGFSPMMLAQAAHDAPFEPHSTLEDVTIPDARAAIEQTPDVGRDLFALDHVFLTTKKKEH